MDTANPVLKRCCPIWWPPLLTGLLLVAVGCGGLGSSDPKKTNMAALATLYSQYQGNHRGQLPANEQQLREFVEGQGSAQLEYLGYQSLDDLLVSTRDGQPFVVLYGADVITSGEAPGGGIIAYEQTGKNGTRLVGYRAGGVEEVTEEQFREMVPAP